MNSEALNKVSKAITIFSNEPLSPHYYGDIVRRFFIAGALIMLISLPFFITRLPVSLYAAIFIIVVLGFFAGATNPKQLWSSALDVIISLIAFCVFEYYAVKTLLENSWIDGFLWINESLAIIFFIAFYYAVKTIRGFLVEKTNQITERSKRIF